MNNSSNVIPTKFHRVVADQAYDSTGATIYIIFVLFWYSMGIVCMLAMQIKARDETIEDCARRRARLLLETLGKETHTKQILEELVDKEKRDRLWDIYRGTNESTYVNEKLVHAESVRIRHIEKQLAMINQTRLVLHESLVTSTTAGGLRFDARSVQMSNASSSLEARTRVRRRSSFDQQIIERWKCLVEQCKTHEQLPWTIQKRLIRRHFRRNQEQLLRDEK